MNAGVLSSNAITPSLLSSNTNFTFSITSADPNDRASIGFIDLNYPRLFNFGGQPNFAFKLPATPQGNYLEISNFTWGNNVVPVLYDLSNGRRYTANTDVANLFDLLYRNQCGKRISFGK